MKSKLALLALTIAIAYSASAQLQWVAFNGTIPNGAIIGGNENGTNLAVCRGQYQGSNHPGKLVGANCNIGYGGSEIQLQKFEVLVNDGSVAISWQPVNGAIPPNAVEAGSQDGKRIFVGQADRAQDGSVHPGKVIGVNGDYICNYGYGGAEIVAKSNYRILTAAPLLEWRPFAGSIPDNAVKGGKENNKALVVCRAEYKGATHPGKVIGTNCNIGYGGREIGLPRYELLINNGANLVWEPFRGSVPSGAVAAGTENGSILYVGQTNRTDGSVHPGKVMGTAGAFIFNYGYGGKEITVKANYNILVQRCIGGC